jgi:hypothetical protein
MHRFLWDMHYAPLPGVESEYPISAVPHNTAVQPTSPWVMPGQYTAILTANGKSYTQPLTVKMDPRVKAPLAGVAQQGKLSHDLYTTLLSLAPAVEQAGSIRKQLKDVQARAQGDALAAVKAFDQKVQELAGGVARRPGAGTEAPTLGGMRTRFLALLGVLQEADVAPTTQATSAITELQQQLPPLMQRWQEIRTHDIPALNQQLKNANLPELKLEAALPPPMATVSSKDED